jgi:hypothetical protein
MSNTHAETTVVVAIIRSRWLRLEGPNRKDTSPIHNSQSLMHAAGHRSNTTTCESAAFERRARLCNFSLCCTNETERVDDRVQGSIFGQPCINLRQMPLLAPIGHRTTTISTLYLSCQVVWGVVLADRLLSTEISAVGACAERGHEKATKLSSSCSLRRSILQPRSSHLNDHLRS